MKVALFEKPHRLLIATKPFRPLGSDEVLVKVLSCGICGTDVHIVEGTSRSAPPVVLGHEYSGIVEDTGPAVSRLKKGDHVAVDPNIVCGTCFYCRRGLVHLCSRLQALGVDVDGGMAEYCYVSQKQAYVLPENIRPHVGAFIEPLSCAIHGIDKAQVRTGDAVVILGGGTIGLMMLQLAKNAGASLTVVVEPLEHKRSIATLLGADIVLNPDEINIREAVFDLTKVGSDVVIECVGRPQAAELAVQVVRRGGVVEFFGVCPVGEKISVQPNEVYMKELTIVGSYINPHTFSRSITLLQSGKVRVDEFEFHLFPLDGVHEAFEYQRKGKTIKSIIQPHQ